MSPPYGSGVRHDRRSPVTVRSSPERAGCSRFLIPSAPPDRGFGGGRASGCGGGPAVPKLPCPRRHATGRDVSADPLLEPDELEHCDGLMVLVLDPVTGAADTYGPYP